MTEANKDAHGSILASVECDDWMYQCLAEAKSMIKRYHVDFDAREFFKNTNFEMFKGSNTSIYVDVSKITNSHFQIGINPALSHDSFENQRDLVIVLIRALLSVIYANYSSDKIDVFEKDLGILGAYDVALNNLKEQAMNNQRTLVSFPKI